MHEVEYPEITAEYAQRWNDGLCKYCLQNKLNLILETTFTAGDRLNTTIRYIKEAGYQLDIKLLTVDPRLSLLGVCLRYEYSKIKLGVGRFVSKEAHDIRYKAIPVALKKVQETHLYDNIYIYARTIATEQTDLIEGITLIANNPLNPLKTYQEELQRPWPKKMTQYFDQKCQDIIKLMQERHASIKEIHSFKEKIGLKVAGYQKKSHQKGEKL